MKAQLTGRQVSLAVRLHKGEVYSVPTPASGVRIRVIKGRVWFTHPTSGRDSVLAEGQCFDLLEGGLMVSEGMQESEFRVELLAA